MKACDLDVVARSAERGMGREILRRWDNKFGGTSTSQTCKGKEEFKVATTGAGVVITWEVLKTGLRAKACLDWICVLVCRCGCNFYNISRCNRNCTDKKTW